MILARQLAIVEIEEYKSVVIDNFTDHATVCKQELILLLSKSYCYFFRGESNESHIFNICESEKNSGFVVGYLWSDTNSTILLTVFVSVYNFCTASDVYQCIRHWHCSIYRL